MAVNHLTNAAATAEFFNKIRQKPTLGAPDLNRRSRPKAGSDKVRFRAI